MTSLWFFPYQENDQVFLGGVGKKTKERKKKQVEIEFAKNKKMLFLFSLLFGRSLETSWNKITDYNSLIWRLKSYMNAKISFEKEISGKFI